MDIVGRDGDARRRGSAQQLLLRSGQARRGQSNRDDAVRRFQSALLPGRSGPGLGLHRAAGSRLPGHRSLWTVRAGEVLFFICLHKIDVRIAPRKKNEILS